MYLMSVLLAHACCLLTQLLVLLTEFAANSDMTELEEELAQLTLTEQQAAGGLNAQGSRLSAMGIYYYWPYITCSVRMGLEGAMTNHFVIFVYAVLNPYIAIYVRTPMARTLSYTEVYCTLGPLQVTTPT